MKLSRRSFTASLAASMAVAGSITQAAVRSRFRYGVQLYPLLGQFASDMPRLFDRIAQAGFQTVEFASFAKYSPAEIRTALANAGLRPAGAHCLELYLSDGEASRQIDICAEIGIPRAVTALAVVRPTAERPRPSLSLVFNGLSVDDLKWSAERMRALARLSRARGLDYAFHTHNIDFRQVEGQTGLDYLMQLTSPADVELQLDIGNAVVAGADPVAVLKLYSRRVASVHIKEWAAGFTPTFRLRFPPAAAFGSGSTDWQTILRELRRLGIADVIVEQEAQATSDTFAAQVQALSFIRTLR